MDREVGLVVHLARLRLDGEASVECVGGGWREGSIGCVFGLSLVLAMFTSGMYAEVRQEVRALRPTGAPFHSSFSPSYWEITA